MCDNGYWECKKRAERYKQQKLAECGMQKCAPTSRFPTMPNPNCCDPGPSPCATCVPCTPCCLPQATSSRCSSGPSYGTDNDRDGRYGSINFDNYPTCREPHADGPCTDYVDPRKLPCPPHRSMEEVMNLRKHPDYKPPTSKCAVLADCCYKSIHDDDDDEDVFGVADRHGNHGGHHGDGCCSGNNNNNSGVRRPRRCSNDNSSSNMMPCCQPMTREEFCYWLEQYKTFRRHERRMQAHGIVLGPRCAFPEWFPPNFDHFFRLRHLINYGSYKCN